MDKQREEERRELANRSFNEAKNWAALAATHMEDEMSDYARAASEAAVSRAYSGIAGAVAQSMDYAAGYDGAVRDLAAGQGLEIEFLQERAEVGRDRIKAAGGDVDLAIERAVVGE